MVPGTTRLRQLAVAGPDEQDLAVGRSSGAAAELQPDGAQVGEPHLVGRDPVPGGRVAGGEQEVDERRGGPDPAVGQSDGLGRREGLPEPAALRVRLQVQRLGQWWPAHRPRRDDS